MMSKEELKPVMFAWLNGQPVEFRVLSNPHQPWSLSVGDCPDFFNSELLWRIKPEKKLRPWKPEEVPMPCVLRTKNGQVRWQILSVSNCGVGSSDAVLSSGVTKIAPFSSLLENNEYSTNGGKTWHPCGVEE